MKGDTKNKLASVIVAGLPKPPSTKSEESEGGGESDEEMIASDILSALDDKDPKALASALSSFVKACSGSYDDDEEEEDE